VAKTSKFMAVGVGVVCGLLVGVLIGSYLTRAQNGARDATALVGNVPPAAPPTGVATELDFRKVFEKVAADNSLAAAFAEGRSTVDSRGGLSRQYDGALFSLKDQSQGPKLAAAIQKAVEDLIVAKGGTIWQRREGGAGVESGVMKSVVLGYRLAGRRGQVFLWSTMRAECLGVAALFYETDGEFEKAPGPIPGPFDAVAP
jgi:hypothetical protein